jgi:CheY-like chemotaxis protein
VNLLLVDDEPGIREGLATFLRLRGHVVHTAATVAAAGAAVQQHEFDLLVSDWRLPDGTAADVVRAARCPSLVVTGHPDEVPAGLADGVLGKPVLPGELAARIDAFGRVATPAAAALPPPDGLPEDLADRARLLEALSGSRPDVADDGGQWILSVPVPDAADRLLRLLAPFGGDLRLDPPAQDRRLRWRLARDGRPDGVELVIAGDGAWPDGEDAFAIDMALGRRPAPEDLLRLVRRIAAARAGGRQVHLLNLPSHLRLWLEVSGNPDDMPKRAVPGPCLPPVLAELWS